MNRKRSKLKIWCLQYLIEQKINLSGFQHFLKRFPNNFPIENTTSPIYIWPFFFILSLQKKHNLAIGSSDSFPLCFTHFLFIFFFAWIKWHVILKATQSSTVSTHFICLSSLNAENLTTKVHFKSLCLIALGKDSTPGPKLWLWITRLQWKTLWKSGGRCLSEKIKPASESILL